MIRMELASGLSTHAAPQQKQPPEGGCLYCSSRATGSVVVAHAQLHVTWSLEIQRHVVVGTDCSATVTDLIIAELTTLQSSPVLQGFAVIGDVEHVRCNRQLLVEVPRTIDDAQIQLFGPRT